MTMTASTESGYIEIQVGRGGVEAMYYINGTG